MPVPRHSCARKMIVPAAFAIAAWLAATPAAAGAQTHKPATRILAQQLVDAAQAAHPEASEIGILATTSRGCLGIASTDRSDVGEKCEADDITPMKTGKPSVGKENGGFDVSVPLRDASGAAIGVLGVGFKPAAGQTDSSVTALALRIAAEMAPQVASKSALFVPAYHIVATDSLGGDGSWDYLAFDTAGHRVFIARQNRIMVVDPSSGKLLGEVPGIMGAHGVAFSYATGKGFATSGNDSSVVMFDLRTLKVLGRTHAAEDADGILFDPATKRVFTMNGDAHSSSVIDPATGRNVGTIPLGGKPEFGVSAGNGRLYANLTELGLVVEIDAAAMKVVRRWPVAPCASSTGMSIDVAHHRLFSVCRNKYLAVSDITAGRLLTTLPIGSGVDASRFDPATQLIFASNGDGTMTIVHEDTPDKYTVVQTVATGAGAKTMTLDRTTHRVYLGTATFGPVDTSGGRRRRAPVIPGSFKLLVLDRQ